MFGSGSSEPVCGRQVPPKGEMGMSVFGKKVEMKFLRSVESGGSNSRTYALGERLAQPSDIRIESGTPSRLPMGLSQSLIGIPLDTMFRNKRI